MCAINGFSFSDERLIQKMNGVTAHRGPDDTGIFLQEGISLGHNRLSIIDPTQAGHQPMTSSDKSITVILNGEIYNFKELKKELKNTYTFITGSDTEVLIAAYKKWDTDCFTRLNGIFACAIWDDKKKRLVLARDHIGVKPLYYFLDKGRLLFSSEIKAITEHDIPRTIDTEAFSHFFRLLYTPAPTTLFSGIRKFPPAHYGIFEEGKLKLSKYWEPHAALETRSNLHQELKECIGSAVKRQLVSDKPLGVYLSGGIDSSIVLDAVSAERKNVDTFSVGFDLTHEEQVDKFNADFLLARKTAAHYGTVHHEVLLSSTEAVELLEKSIWHMDEPIANPTALARLKLATFAKEKVDVVLGGDGGDELFGGYERYRLSHTADVWQRYVPAILRPLLTVSARSKKLNIPAGTERYKLFMFQKDLVLREILKPEYLGNATEDYFTKKYFHSNQDNSFTETFLDVDRKTWLVDESLTLSDKMAMASGLELRVPLLDPRVVSFSKTIPGDMKVTLFNTKIILKEAYKHTLPAYLFQQPKRGWFSPAAKWLRHPHVYTFAKEVLSPGYYQETADFFVWKNIESMLEEHYTQKRYNLTTLWSLLIFQLWSRRFSVKK